MTYMQAQWSQIADRKGRGRTDEFEYFSYYGLTDRNILRQMETEIGQVVWGIGLKFGYLDVHVSWI
jgi:hypothetical protein